jgi:hypothetical protein
MARARRKNPVFRRGSRRGASRRLPVWLPRPQAAQSRWLQRLSRLPTALRIGVVAGIALILAFVANGAYQLVRKPTELFFPVSGALYKTPAQTWRVYGPLFRRYATASISAPLLAALAQQEASGNPLVRTYWRWSWVDKPFEIYRPASSAVGMYQITDGTFDQARHYCIRDHVLMREGALNDWRSCWFNRLYLRVLPGDAVELTAAYLDLNVSGILSRHGLAATPARVRHVAATVHLCGAGAADAYVRRGLRFGAQERCGDHDPRAYLKSIDTLTVVFTRLAAAAPPA